ncbi:MAG: hypothetical protein AAB505_02195 [Patescibacteria group bacterium]
MKFQTYLIILLGLGLLGSSITGQAQTAPNTGTVDLIWEAETYTPPFYRGRSLPTSGSLVRVIAIPHFYNANGQRIKDEQLFFRWNKDRADLSSASGAGKNVLTYRPSHAAGSANSIEVTVGRTATDAGVKARVAVLVVTPKIIFYSDERVVKNLSLATDQAEIIAEPFYFSLAEQQNKTLKFNWQMNGRPTETARTDPRLMTLTTPADGATGQALVELKITNPLRPLQTATAKLPVSFGLARSLF